MVFSKLGYSADGLEVRSLFEIRVHPQANGGELWMLSSAKSRCTNFLISPFTAHIQGK